MHDVGDRISPLRDPDPLTVALREIEVAIELVLGGAARVVELAGLEAAERAAGQGLAQAQGAGVHFELHRSSSSADIVSLRIGPVIDD
jgi:hypothetical protein